MTVIDILIRNRDLALRNAETEEAGGYSSQWSRGQANAYAESIRIIEADAARTAPVVQFRCQVPVAESKGIYPCWSPATLRTPTGEHYCQHHAPTDVELTISNHDDQRVTP